MDGHPEDSIFCVGVAQNRAARFYRRLEVSGLWVLVLLALAWVSGLGFRVKGVFLAGPASLSRQPGLQFKS